MRKSIGKYVFRWKNYDGRPLEVTTPSYDTPEEVWKWAIQWLRPAGMKDDAEAEKLIRCEGEVIEVTGEDRKVREGRNERT